MVPVFASFEDKNGHRHERELTEKERYLFSNIEIDGNVSVPTLKFDGGDEMPRLPRMGITHTHQLYSNRNLIILARLWELISECNCSERMKSFLRIWFTSSQSRLHMMNRYAVKHHRHVGPLANTLYVSATPTEISPFYFVKSKIKDNGFDIVSQHNVVNQITSATTSQLPDNSIDYIFTDPPFGSNIMYSELNFLWESWLGIRTNNKEEAIISDSQNKSLPEYQELMVKCFKEYYRVLKPGKWITIEFSNTSASVWNSIQLALNQAGFVVSTVSDLNKGRAGLHGIIGVVAVNQDLAISCYKPLEHTNSTVNRLSESSVWPFIEDYLSHLGSFIIKDNVLCAMAERSPKILYDRVISFFVVKGLQIPIDAAAFQQGLRERFVEKDGMFFTASQAIEYEEKKKHTSGFAPMGIIVSDEANGIQWLRNELGQKSQTYQDLQPKWMQALMGKRKGDIIPEMQDILDENFIKEPDGKWRLPDANDEKDLEILRTKALLKEFNIYVEQASKPKSKIKEARVEALRAGFKQCYIDKDFKTIVMVGDKIPENLLTEDEVLLQYYDIASSRV